MEKKMKRKITVIAHRSYVGEARHNFYVSSTLNCLDFIPGDRMTLEELQAAIRDGIEVSVRRKTGR